MAAHKRKKNESPSKRKNSPTYANKNRITTWRQTECFVFNLIIRATASLQLQVANLIDCKYGFVWLSINFFFSSQYLIYQSTSWHIVTKPIRHAACYFINKTVETSYYQLFSRSLSNCFFLSLSLSVNLFALLWSSFICTFNNDALFIYSFMHSDKSPILNKAITILWANKSIVRESVFLNAFSRWFQSHLNVWPYEPRKVSKNQITAIFVSNPIECPTDSFDFLIMILRKVIESLINRLIAWISL